MKVNVRRGHISWYRDDRGELSFVFKDCELSSLLAESLDFLYIHIRIYYVYLLLSTKESTSYLELLFFQQQQITQSINQQHLS